MSFYEHRKEIQQKGAYHRGPCPLGWRDELLRGAGQRGTRDMEVKGREGFRKILAEQFQLMLDEGKAEGAGRDGFTAWVSSVR